MPSPEPPPSSRATTWKAALAGVLLFAAADALVFRTGLYVWLIKPDSSTGWVAERGWYDEAFDGPPSGKRTIAALGDSRMGDALAAHVLTADWPDGAAWARNASMPGSSPRVWSYLLEHLDPDGDRFDIVLVPLVDYDDYDPVVGSTDRALDLPFLPPLTGLADLPELVGSFATPTLRAEAVQSALVRTFAYRRDLQDLFAAPLQRSRDLHARISFHGQSTPYEGVDGDLTGVRVDGDRVEGLPADASPQLVAALTQLCKPRPPDRGREREYRRQWLGRIADHLAGGHTRLVFLRLPSQFLPRPDPRPAYQPTLDELAQRPNVHVLPRDLFAELERPEFFRDALHLNRRARARFTAILGAALVERFGADLGR